MRQKDNELILKALQELTEPVERNELMLLSGVNEQERFNNAVSYLE